MKETLSVIASGRVAPYASGEHIETIKCTKAAILRAIIAGHFVLDADGNRVDIVGNRIERYSRGVRQA